MPLTRHDTEPAARQASYSAHHPTPLNPVIAVRGTTLELSLAIPSGQTVTHSHDGQTQTAASTHASNHRVVLRAQERTRTIFTTPKNHAQTRQAA